MFEKDHSLKNCNAVNDIKADVSSLKIIDIAEKYEVIPSIISRARQLQKHFKVNKKAQSLIGLQATLNARADALIAASQRKFH